MLPSCTLRAAVYYGIGRTMCLVKPKMKKIRFFVSKEKKYCYNEKGIFSVR